MAITAGASAAPLSSRGKRLVGAELERCIFCRGASITREGKRYKKLETVQLWYCRDCDRIFSPQRALATDSVTIAVEVPVYLSPQDLAYFKKTSGFDIPLETEGTLTRHIDFLQIRNGSIHIVDYKPNARSERPIPQLMVYALALSRRTGLRLYDFVCSWFDEHSYYQFFPLHVVHKRSRQE
jgi:hypothetical protein